MSGQARLEQDAVREAVAAATRLLENGQVGLAEQVCRGAIAYAGDGAEPWFLLAAALHLQGKLNDAVAAYNQALARDPAHRFARNNLAVALQALGRLDESAAVLEATVAASPEHAEALNNLGNVRQRQGRFEEAVRCYERALQARSDYLEALNNLGNVNRVLGRFDEALTSYERALRLNPEHPRVRLARALLWLQMGDYARGFAEHEWRFRCPEYALPAIPGRRWDGGELAGKTILLYADSGLGDAIQFSRYARDVAARGGRVVLVCRRPLVRIMASCPGVDQVVVEGADWPEFQVYAPLMSLPYLLGVQGPTGAEVVPYLRPEEQLVERWQGVLGAYSGFRIGIAWQGNPAFVRDGERSFRLESLAALAGLAGVTLLSLQKGAGHEQIAQLEGRFLVHDLGARLDDLADTAAAMLQLDLVITPDTAVAHLAGAIGVRTWVALGFAPDWRWRLDTHDSAWYPHMRLFRQHRPGDWSGVFEAMRNALIAILPNPR